MLPSLVCMLEKSEVWLLKSAGILEIWCSYSRVWSPESAVVARLVLLCLGLQKQAVQKDICGINLKEKPRCCPNNTKP